MCKFNCDVADLESGQSIRIMDAAGEIVDTGEREQFCADCDGMTWMPWARAVAEKGDATITILLVQCPHCDGLGHEVHLVAGGADAPRFGVMRLSRRNEDMRLEQLHAEGVPVWIKDRDETDTAQVCTDGGEDQDAGSECECAALPDDFPCLACVLATDQPWLLEGY